LLVLLMKLEFIAANPKSLLSESPKPQKKKKKNPPFFFSLKKTSFALKKTNKCTLFFESKRKF